MKKTLPILLLGALIAAGITGASLYGAAPKQKITANRNYVTRSIDGIRNFNEIRANGIADVEYTQSSGRPNVEIYGAENILQYLKVEVKGNSLEINIDDRIEIRGEHRLKVRVSSNSITSVSTSGTGDIDILGTLSVENLEMVTTGTGDIDFNRIISSGNVTMTLKGTGDADGRSIRSNSLRVNINGTGDLDIDDLESRNVELTIAGTGDAEVDNISADIVEVTVSGTGGADLSGRTERLTAKVTGTGSIDADDLRADIVNATVSGLGSISCYPLKEIYGSESGMGSIKYKGTPGIVDIKKDKRRR